jgi:hypothetical protein
VSTETFQVFIDATDRDGDTDRTTGRRTQKSDNGITPHGNGLPARQAFGYINPAAGILRQTAHHNINNNPQSVYEASDRMLRSANRPNAVVFISSPEPGAQRSPEFGCKKRDQNNTGDKTADVGTKGNNGRTAVHKIENKIK